MEWEERNFRVQAITSIEARRDVAITNKKNRREDARTIPN